GAPVHEGRTDNGSRAHEARWDSQRRYRGGNRQRPRRADPLRWHRRKTRRPRRVRRAPIHRQPLRVMFEQLRSRFPVTERFVYMNHAALGPLPQPAVERVGMLARTLAESADELWTERLAEAERVRGLA